MSVSKEILCLGADTQIPTINGDVPISDIRVGDVVLNMDPVTQKVSEMIIFRTASALHNSVVLLVFSNGETLVCTPDHPIWAHRVGWSSTDATKSACNYGVDSQKLRTGQSTYFFDRGRSSMVTLCRIEHQSGHFRMYNISCGMVRNYLANGFSVHDENLGVLDRNLVNRSALTFEEMVPKHRGIHVPRGSELDATA